MKKTLTKITAFICLMLCAFSFSACKADKLAVGKEYIAYKSQLDALTQLNAGSVDAVVIDLIMANYSVNKGNLAGEVVIVDELVFAEEEYGIAAKKGNKALMSKINEGLIAIRETGLSRVAEKYGLTNEVVITEQTTDTYADATDNSWNDLVDSGTLVIGYTVFEPIAIADGNTLIGGFDIELAYEVIMYLNETYDVDIQIQFQLIEWETKETKLADGTLDLIWNGLTITEERSNEMCISIPYLKNRQVAVVKTADASKYSDVASFKNAIMGAEAGSAGESVIKGK